MTPFIELLVLLEPPHSDPRFNSSLLTCYCSSDYYHIKNFCWVCETRELHRL